MLEKVKEIVAESLNVEESTLKVEKFEIRKGMRMHCVVRKA